MAYFERKKVWGDSTRLRCLKNPSGLRLPSFFRPLHNPAPSLHPPPAAVGLGSSLPVPGAEAQIPYHNKKASHIHDLLFCGGEGEIRTPAPVSRPTPLAGEPLHQLEYFSVW